LDAFWTAFWPTLFADGGVGLGLFGIGYLVVNKRLPARERKESRARVLKAVLGELYSNAAQLTTAEAELPTGGIPYPLFDVGMWHVLSEATIFTTLNEETVSALMHAYNRMGASNDQCSYLLDINKGRTAILAMGTFAGRMAASQQVKELHDQFQDHRSETRAALLDRLADLRPFLENAIDAVEAELEIKAVPAAQRLFLGSMEGVDGRSIGTPRQIVKLDVPDESKKA
jgi:hypothetical protein